MGTTGGVKGAQGISIDKAEFMGRAKVTRLNDHGLGVVSGARDTSRPNDARVLLGEQYQHPRQTSMAGWLTKLGGFRKNWKRRFFTCERNVLSYATDEQAAPLHSLDLCFCSDVALEDQIARPNCFR
ncbi:uncharacterized protein MONBRDRAFT_7740, partial [Monosiga brevicollis MX1]